jgi:hypothetical protein
MNFHWPLFHRPPPSPEPLSRGSKGQFIPSRKERVRRANEASVLMQLGILTARLSPEEKREAVERGSTR